jgi:Leucine-rich repeat (LRR) protein
MDILEMLKSEDKDLHTIAEILISSDDTIFFNKEISNDLIKLFGMYSVELISTLINRVEPEVLEKITSLDLSNRNIYTIPSNIFLLDNIKQLKLNDNNISVIPDSISNLKKLDFLDISNNNLSEFPYHLPKKITKLHIIKNKIKQLDRKKMSKFLHLFEFKFDTNNIKYI